MPDHKYASNEAFEHLKKANLYRDQNKLEQALAECELATRSAPDWADAHYLRGILLKSLGRSDESIAAFDRASQLTLSSSWDFPANKPPIEASNDITPEVSVENDHRHDYQWWYVPWTVRDTWYGLGLAALLSIAVPFGIIVLSFIFTQNLDLPLDLLVAINSLLLAVPVWWFVRHKYRASWDMLGFCGFGGRNLGIGCLLMIGLYFVMGIYGMVLGTFIDEPIQPDILPMAEEMSLPWLLPLMSVIAAPVLEEVFFRGFVFAGFRGRYGWWKAALLSAAIFAAIHIQPLAFVPLFLAGFLFAFLYHYSKSIWLPITMHFLMNFMALMGEYLVSSY